MSGWTRGRAIFGGKREGHSVITEGGSSEESSTENN